MKTASAWMERHHPKCRLHGIQPNQWKRQEPCNCPETWEAVIFSRNYPGIWKSRLLPGNHNPREVAFAQQWMEENDPDRRSHLLDTLLDTRPQDSHGFQTGPHPKVSERDKTVGATLMQWLGSNIGMNFLCQAIRRSPEAIRYIKMELGGYDENGEPIQKPTSNRNGGEDLR